jgi:glucokinase
MQLTFMPEGGVWITGGVAINHLDVFDCPGFIAGIHASPAYLAQREEYPLGVLKNHEHALIGSGYYAAKRLLG